jgi:hypothetical protein
MPLLPAYYTTTNLRKRKAKKPSKSAIAHEEWLMAQGLHISQLKKARKVVNSVKDCAKDIKVDRPDYVSAGMSGTKYACAKRGVMTNLHKEPRHIQEAILAKAKRVMPLYNKGGLQVLTDSDDLKALNKVAR